MSSPPPRPAIILAAGRCGPAYHPDRLSDCVPDQRFTRLSPPRPCGDHRDPDPARPICHPSV